MKNVEVVRMTRDVNDIVSGADLTPGRLASLDTYAQMSYKETGEGSYKIISLLIEKVGNLTEQVYGKQMPVDEPAGDDEQQEMTDPPEDPGADPGADDGEEPGEQAPDPAIPPQQAAGVGY